jgi:hypothetical protein
MWKKVLRSSSMKMRLYQKKKWKEKIWSIWNIVKFTIRKWWNIKHVILKKLHEQRIKPPGRNSLCWAFYCVNDGSKVDVNILQLICCMVCYRYPMFLIIGWKHNKKSQWCQCKSPFPRIAHDMCHPYVGLQL